MPQLDRPGRFKAFAVESGISTKESGAIQFEAKMSIAQAFNDQTGEWEDWSSDGYTQFMSQNLIKKDGSINEMGVDAVKGAFGWDGIDFSALNAADWSQQAVQITVEEQEYQGKKRLGVAWLNPVDFEGVQLKKIDEAASKALTAKFGAQLRARSGAPKPAGVPAPKAPAPPLAPPKTAGKAY